MEQKLKIYSSDTAFLVIKSLSMCALLVTFSWWQLTFPEELLDKRNVTLQNLIKFIGPTLFLALWIPNLAGAALYRRWIRLVPNVFFKETISIGFGLMILSAILFWIKNRSFDSFFTFSLAIFSSFYLAIGILLRFFPVSYLFLLIVSFIDLGFLPNDTKLQIASIFNIRENILNFFLGDGRGWSFFPWFSSFLFGFWINHIYDKICKKRISIKLLIIFLTLGLGFVLLNEDSANYFRELTFVNRPLLSLDIFIATQISYALAFFYLSYRKQKNAGLRLRYFQYLNIGFFPFFLFFVLANPILRQITSPFPITFRILVLPPIFFLICIALGKLLYRIQSKRIKFSIRRAKVK